MVLSKITFFLTIGFSLLSITGVSQNCEIQNLVFEGAGIRGIAYAGVIEELEKHGKMDHITRVGGTSAGAITALMVSLGYSSEELSNVISSTRFQKFNDGRFIFIGGVIRMRKWYGWYRGERISKWISGIIAKKTGDPDITFEELYERGYKDLYVTATSLNRQKLIVFSRETYPQMKIKDAVRASMSIPLYFKAVFIDSAGAVVKPHKKTMLDIVVDGGIIGNFPIAIFDSLSIDEKGRKSRIPHPHTLGIRIDSEKQMFYDSLSKELAPKEIVNFNSYISALYVLVIEKLNRTELNDDDWLRTLSVSSRGINPRIRKLSKDQKRELVNSGRMFTLKYFHDHCQ